MRQVPELPDGLADRWWLARLCVLQRSAHWQHGAWHGRHEPRKLYARAMARHPSVLGSLCLCRLRQYPC